MRSSPATLTAAFFLGAARFRCHSADRAAERTEFPGADPADVLRVDRWLYLNPASFHSLT